MAVKAVAEKPPNPWFFAFQGPSPPSRWFGRGEAGGPARLYRLRDGFMRQAKRTVAAADRCGIPNVRCPKELGDSGMSAGDQLARVLAADAYAIRQSVRRQSRALAGSQQGERPGRQGKPNRFGLLTMQPPEVSDRLPWVRFPNALLIIKHLLASVVDF